MLRPVVMPAAVKDTGAQTIKEGGNPHLSGKGFIAWNVVSLLVCMNNTDVSNT